MTVEWLTLSSLVISHAIVNSISFSRFSSVTQSCLTLCDPMDCSMPGFPVHHQFLEFAQTHVHQVSDVIQPSHPLSSPSPQLQWWLLIGRCHLLMAGQYMPHLQGSRLLWKPLEPPLHCTSVVPGPMHFWCYEWSPQNHSYFCINIIITKL